MPQVSSQLIMIRPAAFAFNEQTAVNNVFQQPLDESAQQSALDEFNGMVSLLQQHNVDVTVLDDSALPHTPDSIFPNNWFSTHEDGTLVLYPMFAQNRRPEREKHLPQLKQIFNVKQEVNMADMENKDQFLEGTGSMVLDREKKIAYACISPRTNRQLTEELCKRLGYTPVLFKAISDDGTLLYHTNVMMCVGERFVVVCLDAVPDEEEQLNLRNAIQSSGKELISITMDQMHDFAGNMLEIKNQAGESLVVMSDRAFGSLSPEQRHHLSTYAKLLHTSLDTIEAAGGGSARCMLAEVFLEKNN